MAHAYNKGFTIKILRNVIQCITLKASMKASNVLAVKVWLTAWKVIHSLLPSTLHYIVSPLTAPAQEDREHKPE
jgi:hypothetical protein